MKSYCWSLAVIVLYNPSIVTAVGFDRDDFLVTGYLSNNIGVFDRDFTFKGYLDSSFDRVTGLDFDAMGNVVAASLKLRVRIYSDEGFQIGGFIDISGAIGAASDIKVGESGNFYIATQDYFGGNGVREFTPGGQMIRQFGVGDYESVAVLPGGVLWGGGSDGGDNFLNIFDLVSGSQIGSIMFSTGQGASSMFYSRLSNTVLISDSDSRLIYEYQIDGPFVRSFSAEGLNRPYGVSRGPSGDVFATDLFRDGVYHWKADGSLIEFVDLWPIIDNPVGIVWAGNIIPEPASITLSSLLGLALIARFGRHRSRPVSLANKGGQNDFPKIVLTPLSCQASVPPAPSRSPRVRRRAGDPGLRWETPAA